MSISSLPSLPSQPIAPGAAMAPRGAGLAVAENKEWDSYVEAQAQARQSSAFEQFPEATLSSRAGGLGGTDIVGRAKNEFSRWDSDHNGKVTPSEFKAAIANPEIKGRDAAALVAVKNFLEGSAREKGRKAPASLTEKQLGQLEQNYYGDEQIGKSLDRYYMHALNKINSTPRTLFTTDLPNAHRIIQGGAGSCAYLTPLISLVRRDSQALPEMIKALPRERYEVTFPGTGTTPIPAPTDSEVALYATSGKDGLWLSVMEKAWGASRNAKDPYVGVSTYPEDAIGALTGHASTVAKLPKTVKKANGHPLVERMQKTVGAGRTVTAWTTDKTVTPGIVGYHAYAVVGVDPGENKVRLHNPWGSGEPVDKDGKPRDGRDDGEFDMSLPEFFSNYRFLVCETDSAYVPKSKTA